MGMFGQDSIELLKKDHAELREKRVMIVEDETIVQLHLRHIVESMGHTVVGAVDGPRALALAAATPPDLALLDVRLPGTLDGIETGCVLRSAYGTALVFVTAFTDDRTVQRIVAASAAGYVVKPFSPAEIRAVLATALQRNESMRRAESYARSLDSMFSRTGDAVVAIDLEGRIIRWSKPAAELTGQGADQAMGHRIWDVLGCDDRDARRFADWSESLLAVPDPGNCRRLDIDARDRRILQLTACSEALLDDVGIREGTVVVLHERTRWRPASAADRLERAGLRRVFVYSHDTLGLGHLQRSLNVAKRLIQSFPGLAVLVATGSAVAHRYRPPAGADYLKLPAVRKVSPEHYEARSLEVSDGDILRLRTNLLLRAARDFDPDAVIVDHAPLGMCGEMRPTLEWLRDASSCTTFLGLRDITDEAEVVIKSWKKQDVYGAMRDLYDHIVVYGAASVYDLVQAYAMPADVACKTRYVGYVCETEAGNELGLTGVEALPHPLVVVTIGGGEGASDTLDHYIEMVRRFASRIDFWSLVLTGPLFGDDEATALRASASGLPITVREFVPSTAPYFRSADLLIATAGYNTVVQALRLADRAVIVPRILHRQEQRLRAERLAELGLVDYLHPDRVSPATLFEVVTKSLCSARRPLAEGRAAGVIPLDGATQLVEFCRTLFLHAGENSHSHVAES